MIGRLKLPKMGFGLDYFTAANLPIIKHALKRGIYFFDTADCYSHGESETTLGLAIKDIDRSKVLISSKCGVTFTADGGITVTGTADYIKQSCADSLRRLQVKQIDLYYLHRVSPDTPIEKSAQAFKELIASGQIKHFGLCEVTANQIRRAHKICPVSAVQIEYSPWSRQDEYNGVVDACRELGITLVAYSPLGRAFFTGAQAEYFEGLPQDDFRLLLDRYKGENLTENMKQRAKLEEFARKKSCTLAQLVLAWEMQKGLTPIPSTTKIPHFNEDVAAMELSLTQPEMRTLDAIIAGLAIKGERYPNKEIAAIYEEKEAPKATNKPLHPMYQVAGGLLFLAVGGLFAYQRYCQSSIDSDSTPQIGPSTW